MKDALKKQFRELFENEYPGMETLREKLIKPLWTEVGTPSLVVPIEQNDTNKIKKITIFANQGSDINFVDVELSDTIVLKRNRATINRYISNKIVDVYQSALIFFHYENNQNEWRISYVYKGENNSDRTNAKRYTYLCGKGNYCRTAAERFSELIKTNGYPDNDDMMNAFSVAALTTEFFTQLFKWYDTWACNVCKFPSKNCIAANAELTTENNQIQLIRLITRLIFVWFIKQKDLIPSWIFDRNELKNILAEYDLDSDKKGNYYNAVLQNLFFGALNKKIQERDFAEKSFDGIPNEQYGIKSYFRDDNNNSFFKLSHSEIKKYFEGVPFLNGGLFECLDWDEPIKNNTSHKVHYVDGFSRNKDRRAFIPNALFWSEDENNLGIINILNRYNFTVEESSANDVQVALDPELLGKIFENLLGTYNPETKESARKESGSFYTPREIVSYMVNSSIATYLKEKVPDVSEENIEKLTNDDKSDDEEIILNENQIIRLRNALFEIKILDPACGSGAFPMGILNKLVEIHSLLNKLSANIKSEYNLYIKKGQFINYTPNEDFKINAKYLGDLKFELTVNGITDEKIYNSQELAIHVKEKINEYNKKLNKNTIANLFSQGRIDDGKSFNAIKTKQDIHQIVDADTNEIVWLYKTYNVENKFRQYRNEDDSVNTLFENDEGLLNYDSLYNLKMQIIQDSIFGVDIQPIAVQICKLRFFISLICEQPKTGSVENNYGYNPLPNLETKFVAANTLIGLNKQEKTALELSYDDVNEKKDELINVRKEHFRATSALQKKEAREKDAILRSEIVTLLEKYSSKANEDKIVELKHKIQKLEEEIINLPIEMVSLDNTSSDLFGYIDENILTYDKNQKNRKEKQTELRKTKQELKLEEAKNNSNELVSSLAELVKWNPYDQNSISNFFDPDWMFGITEGFDIVIGNPPYMRVQLIQKTQPEAKKYYEEKYIYSTGGGAYDLANVFFERALELVNSKGICSYIFPHKFLNSDGAASFRDWIKDNGFIKKIAHFGANQIFKDVNTYTCIVQFSKDKAKGFYLYKAPYKVDYLKDMWNADNYNFISYSIISDAAALYGKNNWIMFPNEKIYKVFKKIYGSKKLSDVLCDIFQGIATSKDDLYILEKVSKNKYKLLLNEKEYELEPELFKPFLKGKDVQKWSHLSTDKYVFFPYEIKNEKGEPIELKIINEKYPLTYKYIIENEKEFKKRENNKASKMKCWYAYLYPKNLTKFEQLKLTSMEICADHPNVTINRDNLYHTTKAYSWVKKADAEESYEYLLAIANSPVIWWFLKLTGDTLQGDARTFKTEYLNPFPLPENVSATDEKKIVSTVNEILEIKEKSPEEDISEKEAILNKMIYDLYGLTEDDIKIIENANMM